ncbi:MAG: Gfo/Idh/MocA family oxidoreductase [Planctomycetes bacterium]|nr:Gfo/Idh/MocA family oxidoreductase [Planctomycetota bacterium]
MSNPIRIGLIGCGRIMPAHLRGYKALREHGYHDFRITALCARKREDALMFRKRGEGPPPRPPCAKNPADPLAAPHLYVSDFQDDADVQVYTDYREMIRQAPMDAVDIYAPVFLHHDIALAAFEAGKHVIVEKPIAITVKAAHRMVEAADKARKALSVAENAHYSETTRAMAWAIEEDYIGAVQAAFAISFGTLEWSPDKIAADTPWRHQKLLNGGGGATDLGVHMFNVQRYFCGEVDEVMAFVRTFEPIRRKRDAAGHVIQQVKNEVDDGYLALARFASGAVGQYAFCWAGHGERIALPGGTAIYGTKGCLKEGCIVLDDGTKHEVKFVFTRDASDHVKHAFFPLGLKDPFALEKLDFFRAIETGRAPEPSGRQGLRDLAVCYAMIESSLLNAPVKVKDVEAGQIDGYQREINEHYKL